MSALKEDKPKFKVVKEPDKKAQRDRNKPRLKKSAKKK